MHPLEIAVMLSGAAVALASAGLACTLLAALGALAQHADERKEASAARERTR